MEWHIIKQAKGHHCFAGPDVRIWIYEYQSLVSTTEDRAAMLTGRSDGEVTYQRIPGYSAGLCTTFSCSHLEQCHSLTHCEHFNRESGHCMLTDCVISRISSLHCILRALAILSPWFLPILSFCHWEQQYFSCAVWETFFWVSTRGEQKKHWNITTNLWGLWDNNN